MSLSLHSTMCIRSIRLYNCLLSALSVSLFALSGFIVSFPLYLSRCRLIRLLLSPFCSIYLLAGLSGFVVSFPLYLSSCRPIRLCCLLSALSVFLPPYQALLSPFRYLCLLAALSGFVVSFRSICDLAALSGFVVSFPFYLSFCRPIRLYYLLPALSVSLHPYQDLLSPFHSIFFLPPYQALLSPFRFICLLVALSGFIVSFPLYLAQL